MTELPVASNRLGRVGEPAAERALPQRISAPAVELIGVSRQFRRPRVSPLRPGGVVDALEDLSLTVPAAARFGIVGESGSGKTTLIRLMAGLDQPTTGIVRVNGIQISGVRQAQLGWLRRSLQVVFQDPTGSLDPRMRVGAIVAEPLVAQGFSEVKAIVASALTSVGLDPSAARRFPHQFSGGQRQRISIARAIAPGPSILIADEAVSALDVTVRAQILDLLADLAHARELTLVFVSHDLSVVRAVCDRVAVFQRGRLVETGLIDTAYDDPQQQYTKDLLAAVPTLATSLAAARARQQNRARAGASSP